MAMSQSAMAVNIASAVTWPPWPALCTVLARVSPNLNDKRKKGMVACFEADRNPDKSLAN